MLEADVREQDDGRVDDVRRVETSAEPGLDDGRVDLALGEVRERSRGERLELRRADGLGGCAHTRDRAFEGVGVGVEPLVPAAHVRRRVRADREAVGTQQRGDRARRRRLAVRADDVHGAIRTLRVVERVEERVHTAEAELLRPRGERRDPLRVVHPDRSVVVLVVRHEPASRVERARGFVRALDLQHRVRAAALRRPARERVHDRARVPAPPRVRGPSPST